MSDATPDATESQPLSPVDFLLITALEEERDALHRHLGKVTQLEKDHGDVHTYFFAEVATGRHVRPYRVVTVCLLRMGPLHAAALTAAAVVRWRPQAVIMVGIAGGVRGATDLGDILLSEKVVDYTVGKVETTLDDAPRRTVRWEPYPADATLLDDARNLRVAWIQSISVSRPKDGEPSAHCGTIASGGDVIAHAGTMEQLRATWPKLVGVEMEGGGVATALHAAFERPRFLMIRGVSDLADAKKNKRSTAAWRPYACDAASAYLLATLRSASLTPRGPELRHSGPPSQKSRGPSVGELQESSAAQRARDLVTLSDLWATIPTDQVDLLIERSRMGIVPDSLLFYLESFCELYTASNFYLYDEKIRNAVAGFAKPFAECLSYGDFMILLPNGIEYKFMPQHQYPTSSEWKDARARFDQAVAQLGPAFHHLVEVTRQDWQEIDLAVTSKAARAARARFEADVREQFGRLTAPQSEPELGSGAAGPAPAVGEQSDDRDPSRPSLSDAVLPAAPSEPSGSEDAPLHEKFAGTIASNRADIAECRTMYRFRAKLLAKSRHETLRAVTFHELYRRADGSFLVMPDRLVRMAA